MENFSKIQNNKNEITKMEFEEEKEKSRLNLRKIKLEKILSSKRKMNLVDGSDTEIKKNYSLNLDDIINNIPDEYKINIIQFLDKVRQYILYIFIYSLIYHH
jgi:hypothetical protein